MPFDTPSAVMDTGFSVRRSAYDLQGITTIPFSIGITLKIQCRKKMGKSSLNYTHDEQICAYDVCVMRISAHHKRILGIQCARVCVRYAGARYKDII